VHGVGVGILKTRRKKMGYRSQVKSVVYQTEDKFDKFYKDHEEEIDYFKQELGCMGIAKKDNYKVLYMDFDEIKWYDTFPEVIAWKKFLADAEAAGMYYEFVRLGEDDSDVEIDYGTNDSGNYILELERHIKTSCFLKFD
jgi:hypothetical protein